MEVVSTLISDGVDMNAVVDEVCMFFSLCMHMNQVVLTAHCLVYTESI